MRPNGGCFCEMLRLVKTPESHAWLDAAQLIKHAFGLARTFPNQEVPILSMGNSQPQSRRDLAMHCEEIADFA